MDFMEAVEQMKKGKKVKPRDWKDELYITIHDKRIVGEDGKEFAVYPYIINDAWELVEENKTLSEIENTLIEKLDKDTTEIYHEIKLIDLKDGRQAHLRVVLTTEL